MGEGNQRHKFPLVKFQKSPKNEIYTVATINNIEMYLSFAINVFIFYRYIYRIYIYIFIYLYRDRIVQT